MTGQDRNHVMKPLTKVLFLAMDAGDTFLIQQWAAEGILPNIKQLIDTGYVNNTLSLEGLYEGATWPSLYTGLNPARHGFHSLTQLKPGTYEFYRCLPGEFITNLKFWNHLSNARKKVAILDIPLSGISKGLNGIQMVEWGSHDGVYGFQTWPPALRKEVIELFGEHPVQGPCDSQQRRTSEDYSVFLNKLLEGIKRKTELTIHFLKKGGWDFFAQVYTECHCAGHQLWHLHDPQHPNYDPQTIQQTGDPIREIYIALDKAFGTIFQHVDDQTLLIFLASHRMSHNIGANFAIQKVLERLGVMQSQPLDSAVKQKSLTSYRDKLMRQIGSKLPIVIKHPLKKALITLSIMESPPIGWDPIILKKSKCFPMYNGNLVTGLRVNLTGREPSGIIEPGDEFDSFCDVLCKDLEKIVDYETGKPLIKRIIRTSELYDGEKLNHLPDLLIEWNELKLIGSAQVSDDDSSLLKIYSEKTGLVEGRYSYCRTGDHRPEGLLIARGKNLQTQYNNKTISLMDIVPTLMQIFGLDISDFDGTPISEIVKKTKTT
jgi:predicted AlkP superfamily phosphohydrolase/phosphomutase